MLEEMINKGAAEDQFNVLARSVAYVVLLAGVPAIPFLDDLLDD